MPIVAIEHVEIDANGKAKVVGTGTPVSMIVMNQLNGYSPDEIHAHYSYLSLAQIHAALSYYHDHRAEIDAEIEESIAYAERMRAERPNRFTRKELLERLEQKTKEANPIVVDTNTR
ncbi:MAG: DUF433 domain-containing protein [Planctomycetia bacterium]|nr:DUF433 domain-containing protein [Planctomycetia bacterium]